MPISRRDLAAAGALAFGAASLLANTASSAEGSDEAGVLKPSRHSEKQHWRRIRQNSSSSLPIS